MQPLLTIDANVFVSALSAAEAEHESSLRFLESLEAGGCLLILPTLVRPEISGAIVRTTGDKEAALRAARLAFLAVPSGFIPIDDGLAAEAVEISIESGLKGSDAVYAAVARRYDTVLVTLDREVRRRLPATITCRLPQEMLETS
jgi:predicted nucleic acid-binding protein